MKNNVKRKSYWKLTFKEKQMVNKIMLKQEGYFNVFNISIMIVSALCMLILQNNLVLMLIIYLIIFLVLRFKLFYYYLKHTEINFDIDIKENKEISKYIDNQTKLIFGIFAISMFIMVLGICGVFDNNDDTNGSSCYTRNDGTKCCTACRKNEYGIPKCSTVCN